eukprot:5662446-Amphidinium_carterae.1
MGQAHGPACSKVEKVPSNAQRAELTRFPDVSRDVPSEELLTPGGLDLPDTADVSAALEALYSAVVEWVEDPTNLRHAPAVLHALEEIPRVVHGQAKAADKEDLKLEESAITFMRQDANLALLLAQAAEVKSKGV